MTSETRIYVDWLCENYTSTLYQAVHGNLKKQYTEKAVLSDYISSSNTDLENDLDGLKISSLIYSMITYLKPLYERRINSLRNIMNLLFGKSDFIIKFRRKRKNRIKARGRVIKPQSQIFGKKDLKLFLQSTVIWKTHMANDMELKKIRKKTNFWNLRYSPRSSDISFSIIGNQTVTRPAFSPEAYSALEESYVMCLKWSVWILTFRQARSLRWNRKKAACFIPYSIIFAAMCVRDMFGAKFKSPKRNLGKRLKSVRSVCLGYLLEAFEVWEGNEN